jgi:hypothetical protein
MKEMRKEIENEERTKQERRVERQKENIYIYI